MRKILSGFRRFAGMGFRGLGAGFPYFVAVFLCVAVVAGHPASTKWFGMAVGIGAFLVDWCRRLLLRREIGFDAIDLAWAAMSLYMAVTLAWTPNQGEALVALITASACLALLVYLKEYATPGLMTAMVVAMMASIAVVLLFYFNFDPSYWGGYGNSGALAEALAMALPFCWVLWKHPSKLVKLSGVVMAAVLVGFMQIYSPSAIQEFTVAVLGAAVSIYAAFRRRAALGWLVLLVWLILPMVAVAVAWGPLDLERRLMVRLEVWADTLYMIADAPLFGHGIASFVSLHPLYRDAHEALFSYHNAVFNQYNTEAEAAHNDPLQLLAELGLAGSLPVIALALLCWRACRERIGRDPFATAGAVALLVIMAESLLEYPLQRPASLCMAVLAIAFAAHGRPPSLPRWRLPLPLWGALAMTVPLLAMAGGLGFVGFRQQQASATVTVAQLPGMDEVQALSIGYQAYQLDPWNHSIRVYLPIALNQVLLTHGLASVPPATVDQIFAIAREGGRYNTGVLLAQAQYLFGVDRPDDPLLEEVMADLHRGTSHVAAVHVLEGRYALAHGNREAALISVAEGRESDRLAPSPPITAAFDEIEQQARLLPSAAARSPLWIKPPVSGP